MWLLRYVPDTGAHLSSVHIMSMYMQIGLQSGMCVRCLGGELHLEMLVLGRTAAEVLGRWSFVITTSPMSHPVMHRMSIDRAHHEEALCEDGMTGACRGAEMWRGRLEACMLLLHHWAFRTSEKLWRSALSLGGKNARQHGVSPCSP